MEPLQRPVHEGGGLSGESEQVPGRGEVLKGLSYDRFLEGQVEVIDIFPLLVEHIEEHAFSGLDGRGHDPDLIAVDK